MIPLNLQPAEKVTRREDGVLEVHSVFHTIQGEGPDAGTPAVFVRLAGCSLACPSCDTEYTSKRELVDHKNLMVKVNTANSPDLATGLIVLTGGEPYRQNIGPFVNYAIACGYRVQIETNGGLYLPLPYANTMDLSIVCSPKLPHINPDLAPHISAYKYVMRHGQVDPTDGLPTDVLGQGYAPARPHPDCDDTPIFLQPEDQGDPVSNKMNLQACIESCMKYGYRLSVQLHKIVGLD